VSSLVRLIEASAPSLSWVGKFLAVVVSVLLIFIGVTLGVALFHSDESARRHAKSILRDLLHFALRLLGRR